MAEIPKIWDWSIYKIVNPKNRVYIGITTDLTKRIKHYQIADCRNQQALFHSLKKYGFSEHTFEVIETFTSNKDFAMEREIYWISYFKCNYSQLPKENGLNLTGGGRGSHGRVMTNETKEKLRQANLGKKYSDETKAKLSAMRKGKKINRVVTEEEKQIARERNSKYRHTDEMKKFIGECSKGNKNMLGKKQSKETIAKRVKHLIGNKFKLGVPSSAKQKQIASELFSKPVLQYSLLGDFINEYPSITTAAKEIGVSVWAIRGDITGTVKKPKKFIFKYKDKREFHRFQFQRRIFKLTA